MYLSVDARMGERYYCSFCKEWYRAKFDSSIPAGVGWVSNFFTIPKYDVINAKHGYLNHLDISSVLSVGIISCVLNQEVQVVRD